MPAELTLIAGLVAGLVPSAVMALRLRSEIRKNAAEANRAESSAAEAAFGLLERQLEAMIKTNQSLEKQVRALTTEVAGLRDRIVELEAVLAEVQTKAPGVVAAATANRRRGKRS